MKVYENKKLKAGEITMAKVVLVKLHVCKHKGRVKGSKNKVKKEATKLVRIPLSKLAYVLKAIGKA